MSGATKAIVTLSNDLINLKYADGSEIEPLFYAKDSFKDDGEKIKYIKKVEGVVRSSQEYKDLMKYIRQDLQVNNCTVLTKLGSSSVSVEIHHAPFTLFDITEAIINKRLNENLVFTSLNLAEEILILHYEGLVGLTPLSTTMHELVHSGGMFVNPANVIGNVTEFKNRYEKHFSEEAVEKYVKFMSFNIKDYTTVAESVFDENKASEFKDKIISVNSMVGICENSMTSLEEKGDKDDPYSV